MFLTKVTIPGFRQYRAMGRGRNTFVWSSGRHRGEGRGGWRRGPRASYWGGAGRRRGGAARLGYCATGNSQHVMGEGDALSSMPSRQPPHESRGRTAVAGSPPPPGSFLAQLGSNSLGVGH
jgi:hypothetical protein